MPDDSIAEADSLIVQLAELFTLQETASRNIDTILAKLRGHGLSWRSIAFRLRRARGQKRRTSAVGRLATALRKRLSRRLGAPSRRLVALKAVSDR